ncbi:uncharacterized protein C8Q71DRAFT_348974 [Rhodofomes roseus]|uniref:Uncharacterized protein n=1 Tax=Rhodofomes roseus TaxID=34475 RepID=A0ABQ8KTQ0_9APHY|nr:uncharacterized protein C8Q71DRAFT_348974 [Rhodofomes roseus]KAH9841801.1 hypothetical protein C8Q71DRAFT_348974 [Rhodofomes roseus]
MSINLSKRSKFTESLKKRASGSTLSSMGADPLNPSYVQSQLEEARASLRSQGDTLNDLEYERDALKQEAGKAFVERDEAHESVQKLQEMLDTMRQELAEARRSSVAQDRLTASPQHRLIEMEAAIEAERRARHLTEDAAKRSIAQLEDERDALKRGLQAAQGECAEAKAASQAARDAKDSFREELFTTQLALRHRVDELNMLEDRRIAVELGVTRGASKGGGGRGQTGQNSTE